MEHDYDVVVIGSGFGGSVTALRLVEKGYRVLVLEAGRRFEDHELAATSWHLRDFLWAPALGCYGIQRIHRLRDVLVLAGAGVGGGSLVYANTLYRPPAAFFADPAWAHLTDWADELAPWYDQAERMLGVTGLPQESPADAVMREVAEAMGVGETFRTAPVGVFFNPGPDGAPRPGVVSPDPFFGGVGPARRGCTSCGECMTGCRHGAKNTLVKNYLHLAERGGAQVRALTTVTDVVPLPAPDGAPSDGSHGYRVLTRPTGARGRRAAGRGTASAARAADAVTATHVVVAAGAYGTQRLLHAQRDRGNLPHLSPRLGALTRTNSESLLGAVRRPGPAADGAAAPDYSRGVAITSSFWPDERTHVEPVRYGHGSNAMGLLQTVLVDPAVRPDGTAGRVRLRDWVRALWTQRRVLPRVLDLRRWSERTIIALVMQNSDSSLTTFTRRGPLGALTGRRRLTSRQGSGAPNPSWIPAAHDAVRHMARVMGGDAGGTIGEPFNVPMTAHFLGGCTLGATPADGVVDPYHRVHGHPGLHVVDGSTVSANPGVNPSLTITALAERAMSLWPNRGEADPRPAPGTAYARVRPVAPHRPVVPGSAPGALRLPLVAVRHATDGSPAAQR